MQRREFLAVTAAATLSTQACAPSKGPVSNERIPIIDTHIHLFDPNRPEGIPWPPKDNAKLYQPAYPERYRKITADLGVVGAIKVEASPWVEDNQWVLDVAEKDPIIVGVVGNLEPGTPDFAKNLERFRKNKLFLGIRNGNLWNRDFTAIVNSDKTLADLKLLEDEGLSLDSANPNPKLMADLLRLSDKLPKLRIIIDHLPQLQPPAEPEALKAHEETMQELGKRPQVFTKISAVFRRVDGNIPTDVAFYKDRLDLIGETFGEDRVLYGSDWPNSDNMLPLPDGLKLAQEYFSTKSREAQEKYFWKNSVAAYHWIHRDPSQPKL